MGKAIRTESKPKKVQDFYPEAFTLAHNIDQFCRKYGTTKEERAKATMTSTDTFERRMKQPWKFTMCEITQIARVWRMSPAQLMVEPRYIVDPVEF